MRPCNLAVTQDSAGEHCSPLHLNSNLPCGRIWNPPLRYIYKVLWPRRGQSGEGRKSVKKRAALLHVLAFLFLDHLFGVLRGEQPLRRGPLPRNSGTFFASFFGHKKGRSGGSIPPKVSAPPQGGGKRKPQTHFKKAKFFSINATRWATQSRLRRGSAGVLKAKSNSLSTVVVATCRRVSLAA